MSTTATPALSARDLAVAYTDTPVFEHLNLSIEAGSITSLIGPNGSGKSTLLKAFGRLQPAAGGEILMDGTPLKHHSSRDIARHLAILPQQPITPAATTVRELVSRGRHPHQSLFRMQSAADTAAVDTALADTGISELADRDVSELSGGQLQRAWIALVLAQQTPTVLLDEPTTFLDMSHQLEVLRLVRETNRQRGTTVVMVLHDLSLAARYADRLVVLAGGSIMADGTPWDVLTPDILSAGFGLEAKVISDPVTGTPLVIPIEH